MNSSKNYILNVRNLVKYFPIKKGLLSRTAGYVKAVDDISFSVKEGEILGLVGESGCGKTTVGRSILRLIEPTSGEILFDDKDIIKLKGDKLRKQRKEMQIIFQDPFSSLNPRMTIGNIVKEPYEIHGVFKKKERMDRARDILMTVGINPNMLNRYPHEFSGGQRQRIGIARALALNPKLIIADEPVSALDVSIQAQIINLLVELQKKFSLTYIFIAHDLAVVKHVSDRIVVMYLGKIAEIADGSELYRNPMHPYTQALLSAIPIPDPLVKKQRIILEGDVPTPIDPPSGCRFHLRCRYRQEICTKETPVLEEKSPSHYVACHIVKNEKYNN
jgi:oligopeptide/dipeptide ABC transporter ATP-binding protein